MIKLNLVNSMIGNYYPFFLSNEHLNDSYYLYRLISPSLNPECIPYLSLEKISEKTKNKQPNGNNIDVLSICLGNRKNLSERAAEMVSNIIKRNEKVDVVVDKNKDGEFPLIEMEQTNNIQKALIIGLRDALRWKLYKFLPGNYIDVLWTPTKFIVFEIKGSEDNLWIEPVGMYNNSDMNLTNPIKIDLSKIEYPTTKVSGKNKASDLNRMIKTLEWSSFTRKEIKA